MQFPIRPEMILIDLDGTLIDSVPDLAFCVDAMMQELDLPPRGEAAVRDWVGNGVERLVQRALTGTLDGEPTDAEFERAYPIFLRLYADNTAQRSHPYDGVREGLDWLRAQGYRLGCVTNKAARFTEPLLADKGLRGAFEIVISGDTLPEKKPSPLPLLHAARVLRRRAESGADDRRLGQRRKGGPCRRLQHHLHELRLQSWPRHPQRGTRRRDRFDDRTARPARAQRGLTPSP